MCVRVLSGWKCGNAVGEPTDPGAWLARLAFDTKVRFLGALSGCGVRRRVRWGARWYTTTPTLGTVVSVISVTFPPRNANLNGPRCHSGFTTPFSAFSEHGIRPKTLSHRQIRVPKRSHPWNFERSRSVKFSTAVSKQGRIGSGERENLQVGFCSYERRCFVCYVDTSCLSSVRGAPL